MCGIVGFTSKDWSVNLHRIEDATATLLHRGPDQQGTFRSSLCSLGATRLKILDLSSGSQPFYSRDQDAVIVFNGEIYNHLEVRKKLELHGRVFETNCDTETVLQAFLEWDVEAFKRLRGMFALAIWTNSEQRLVIARDRVGIKPLYLAHRGDDLFFASELKGILIHPEIDRQISRQGLDCYLSLNYVPAPWTLIEGVEKLAPGSWMEWRRGALHTEPYWRPPGQQPQAVSFSQNISLSDAAADLDRLLQQAVSEQMLSDVPLGVWLSGGLDSSTILHYASRASSTRLKTFSISFSGHSFDESSFIREMVSEYDTDHQQLNLDEHEDLEGAVRQLAYYSDEPCADSGALPIWFLSRLTRTAATVAFSGEGADEIFGGYLTYRADAISKRLQSVPAGLRTLALRAVERWPLSDEKIGLEYKVRRLLEGSMLSPAQGHVYWNGTFSAAQKHQITRETLPDTMSGLLSNLHSQLPGDGLSPFLAFDQQVYLPDDILVKSDRMSMAHSVEVRPPFLDHRILEFAARLPSAYKVKGSSQKIILKELMKNKLPSSITKHKKTGFDIPAHQWMRGPLKHLLLEAIEWAEQEHSDFYNFPAIRAIVKQHFARQINAGYHLWGLMILFLWMKEWKIRTAAAHVADIQMLAAKT